jgi:hypothetical protein
LGAGVDLPWSVLWARVVEGFPIRQLVAVFMVAKGAAPRAIVGGARWADRTLGDEVLEQLHVRLPLEAAHSTNEMVSV